MIVPIGKYIAPNIEAKASDFNPDLSSVVCKKLSAGSSNCHNKILSSLLGKF